MMSLTFGLFNQVSGLGPLGPLVLLLKVPASFEYGVSNSSSGTIFLPL